MTKKIKKSFKEPFIIDFSSIEKYEVFKNSVIKSFIKNPKFIPENMELRKIISEYLKCFNISISQYIKNGYNPNID